MARPERHDADYFPFYAKDGKTLFIIENKYQCKGTGFFTNVMRFLTLQKDHYFCIKEPEDRLYFFSKTKCDEVSGADMLDLMAVTGKIDKDLWVSSAVIVSQDLLTSLLDAYRKRINKMITIPEIKKKYVSAGEIRQSAGSYPTTDKNHEKLGQNLDKNTQFVDENKQRKTDQNTVSGGVNEVSGGSYPQTSVVSGGSYPQRKGKETKGKETKEKEIKEKEARERATLSSKVKYLDSVFLADKEYSKLQEVLGQKSLDDGIKKLDYSITVKGGKYKDHYKTLLNWKSRGFLNTGGNYGNGNGTGKFTEKTGGFGSSGTRQNAIEQSAYPIDIECDG